MGKINQPNTQIKLTNVSLVRMKKGKKRFEIACYQNKVQDWRSKVEKDLDEVLQIPQIFVNVSKGQVASNEDLQQAFGSTDVDKIVLDILEKGEIQLNEKERAAKLQQLNNEIMTIVSAKCVNPKTKKRYPPTMLAKVLSELKFNIQPAKAAKIQSLEAIKLLVSSQMIPIARASMKVRIIWDSKEAKKQKEALTPLIGEIEDENWAADWEAVCIIDPTNYRDLGDLIQGGKTKKKGSIEVLDMAVISEGDQNL